MKYTPITTYTVKRKVLTGLDTIEQSFPRHFVKSRVGILAHPASMTKKLNHAIDLFSNSRQVKLTAIFGPQHGLKGETQDNMIEWSDFRDDKRKVPVYSLYGKTRKPLSDMLHNLDILFIDLQDVGSRYYTFVWTMALCMEACQEAGKKVVILDRPNPIGGHLIEGPVLRKEFSSFVGLKPLPVRHGMTIGEIALYLKDFYYSQVDLEVIRMRGWQRTMWFDNTQLPWVLPSPNMPTLDTAIVYPGICLFEGTNLSEGRGTTRPFEIFGAPFVDPEIFVSRLKDFLLPGVVFRPLHFIPTFSKYAGKLCGGAQIHITKRDRFLPFKSAVAILKTVIDLYPSNFQWKLPPYEYEEKLLPIDILMGNDNIREDIESGQDINRIEKSWKSALHKFNKNIREKYLLY